VKRGDYRELKSKVNSREYLRGLDENAPLAMAIRTETESIFIENNAEDDEPQPPTDPGFWLCSPGYRR